MAKAIREKDGKAILCSYLKELRSSEEYKDFTVELPPLRSLTATSTNLEELASNNQWLKNETPLGEN
uniref:Uncharacterized protein n=1 Tax=Amphimedon queenslandica TaxID=400682 RepID=A0A1X7SW72_AMPQE